ncbi:hypothetical protein SEVIR_9G055600v4 [Setaria viridis]|uniref:ENT domain-containing protein n=1 Tax=Setaria viridis TaxID=4556 RepID=A0A4U6T241_SETVI|nr:uncharacterized protein LOC117837933 [Setaria viridis]TKV90836.1 hypothetical protein SEVIR_9G055600v2 [Setaria viridis]
MKLKNSTVENFKENNMIFTSEGKFHAKKVQDDYGAMSNQPAVAQTRCKWIIGDVTEVLDRNTWKLGKILKMLKNNHFVIRLADCIQLKEFHISSLRIPHTVEAPQSKPFPAADKATGRGKRQPADCVLPRSRAVQQMASGAKKRKAAADASHHPSRRAHPRKVAAASMADSYLHSSSQAIEDAECSVASCSVNDPCHPDNGGISKRRRPGAGCLPDDAMSACPCSPGAPEEEHEGAVDVHGLELAAYRSTMRALYASGPLTWEQEALLTNLRLSLNISNEEHLLQLRRLMSS